MRAALTFRLLGLVVAWLPVELTYAAAWLLSLVLAALPSRRRAVLEQNLAMAHGPCADPPAVRRDVRRAFYHALLNHIDLHRVGSAGMDDWIEQLYVPDWQPLHDALAMGRGAILISAHLGNFDTVAQLLALRGYQVYIPMEPIKPPQLLALVRAQRTVLGIDIEPIGPDSFRHMAARLKAGAIVIIVSDRDIQGTGVPVSFLGRTVALPPAAILLGLRTGAPVLGAFGHRYCDGSISGRLTQPLTFNRGDADAGSSSTGRAVRERLHLGMQELVCTLEAAIRMDPGQWVVQQRVFASAPARSAATGVQRSTRKTTRIGSLAAVSFTCVAIMVVVSGGRVR
jgi:KDO2-lipid IV(A) lauroyltransferase